MEYHNEIQKLKGLEELYLKYSKVQCNSDKAIKAFHEWYREMLVLFNRIIPADDEDFMFIKNQETSGTGHILKGLYQRISGRYAMLLDNIERGKYVAFNEKKAKSPLVFISHSHSDKEFAEALVVLLEDLGMDSSNVFCSSVDGYGVGLSQDIFETLRDLFNEHELFVFFIHSPRYYNSAVSLNEMGAAWVLKTNFCSFLTTDMGFDEMVGVINNTKLSIKVNTTEAPSRLTELKNKLIPVFDLSQIDETKWERKRKQFIEKVCGIKYEAKQENISLVEVNKKAVIRAYPVKNMRGQRDIYIKNEGKATATNLRIDIPKRDEYWASQTPLPVTYEELLPGAYRKITLTLIEGQNVVTIHFSWDDEYQNENKQHQTIDL